MDVSDCRALQLGATFYDPPNTISLFFHTTLVCVCVCTELLHTSIRIDDVVHYTSRGFYYIRARPRKEWEEALLRLGEGGGGLNRNDRL